MRIAVLTSLYPSPARPLEGIFAERRWAGMRERGHALRVCQPLPLAPPGWLAGIAGRGDWREIRAAPASEERGGIAIERPRYLHLPGRALGNARRFAARGVSCLAAGPRPDVVVADYAWPAAAAAPLLAERGLVLVISGRGSDVLQVSGEAGLGEHLGAFLKRAGHWCGVSEDLVRAMDALAGAPGQGVLVPNGVDAELFRPRDRRAARERVGVAGEGLLVISVGHLIERKDPLLALRSFACGAPATARLAWIGRGPMEAQLREAARELGVGERLLLPGERRPEELADWYAAADALLLTSRREGRPNVVLEALASGCPVLATDAGGTAELLLGLAGHLLASRDADEIGAALARLLGRPREPEKLRAAVSGYTWSASLDRLEACLARAARDALQP